MSKLSEEQKTQIKEIVATELYVGSETVLDDSKMQDDLNCDSLDYTSILMKVEENFDINILDDDYDFGNETLVSRIYEIVEHYLPETC